MGTIQYISRFDVFEGEADLGNNVFSENAYFDLPGSRSYEELRMLVRELKIDRRRSWIAKTVRTLFRMKSPIDNFYTREFTERALTETNTELLLRLWEDAGDERSIEEKQLKLKEMHSDRYLKSTKVNQCDDWDLAVRNAGFDLVEVRRRVGEFEKSYSDVGQEKDFDKSRRLLQISSSIRKQLNKDFVSDMVREWIALGYRLYEH